MQKEMVNRTFLCKMVKNVFAILFFIQKKDHDTMGDN